MPRYFFDIEDSVSVRDDVGQEFPNTEAAIFEAYRCAAAYGSNPSNLKDSGVIVVTVRDGPDSVALTLRLVCQVETT